MPTKKIDETAVIALFSELQNARAVSRVLDVHENTIYQILRRNRGVCVRCQAPVAHGKKQCDKCLEFDRARVKERRKNRRRLGLCELCDEPHSQVSKRLCEKHRIADLEWREKQYRPKKIGLAGTPHGDVQNYRQKRRGLLAKYGQAGVSRWNHAEGSCEICKSPYTDAAVHVHHIDENKDNNSFENFICLCFRCHRTTHLLIDSKNRKGLIEWFSRTYPDRPLR